MADPNAAPVLPAHIEETIQSIARLHAQHHQNATSFQRVVDRITAFVGRPRFIGISKTPPAAFAPAPRWSSF